MFRGMRSALITAVHARWLPPGAGHGREPLAAGLRAVAGNRIFLLVALGYSTYLLAYNQLYFLMPDVLGEQVGPDRAAQAVAVLMTGASVLIAAGQMLWVRLVGRLPLSAVFGLGFGLMAAGALTAALLSGGSEHAWPGMERPWWAGPAAFVLLLTLGQMTVTPHAPIAAASLSGERHLGAHLGALASAGGMAAMAGTPMLGLLSDVFGAGAAWAGLGGVSLLSAAGLALLLRDPAGTQSASVGP